MTLTGSKVRIHTKEEILEGILISDRPSVVIKLDNGYNIGLDAGSIKSIDLLTPPKTHIQTPMPVLTDASKPNIVILHTGGTIASKVDYSLGAVIAALKPEELLAQVPELAKIANVQTVLVSNIQSEEMRFAHYNKMAEEIFNATKKDIAGIIVTMGTDTLHYASAALAFALENVPIPIVLAGAQRSSDRGSTDARENLLAAAHYLTSGATPGVVVCMHQGTADGLCHILPGTNCRKMHTSRRDAFRAINANPLAHIDLEKGQVTHLSNLPAPNGPFMVRPFKDSLRVGIVRAHPNMYASEITAYKSFDGLIIEATGLGHFPNSAIDKFTKENAKIFKAVGTLAKKMPVAMAPQTIYGRINLQIYTPQRRIAALGVLGHNLDMTVECAFIKMAWLLSHYQKNDIATLYHTNLRGEVHARSESHWFLN